MRCRWLHAAALAAALLGPAPLPLAAQDARAKELRESQARLNQIRQEREALQRQMNELRGRVHDVSGELANISRQISTSAGALKELDFQASTIMANVEATTRQLLLTQDKLVERKAVLHQRLRSIYERGPLHAVRVLLSARNFADLLNRYKYLQLITVYDRLLVQEVQELNRQLVAQDRELQSSLVQLQELRGQKQQELQALEDLRRTRQRTLSQYRARTQEVQGRLKRLAQDEARIKNLLAEIERKRREEERRRAIAGRSDSRERNLTTKDLGALAWPVDGELVYRFGPDRKPNGVTLRNNGIGIAARPGTPVRTVEAGTVVMARPFEGYGPTVMVSHGGGYYTLYLYLGEIRVREGQRVAAGDVIGTVGGERTPEGPHVEFQVRAPSEAGGTPEPVDPLGWLRARSGP
ncbi:MAG: peptidoglycan DD-metalloendopeptidase family protein [Gemmatimonadetes bacterium]|nr:peptidoglycan DD-metalloendopeptidase family protein [Gemmatimonadota bacterium]